MITYNIVELGGNIGFSSGRTNGLGSHCNCDSIADGDIHGIAVGTIVFIDNRDNISSSSVYENGLGVGCCIPAIRNTFRSDEFGTISIANGIITGNGYVR